MAERFRLISGRFPADLAESDSFDAIVALAVLEHIPLAAQDEFAHACFERLRPGGVVILTVPSPMVDRIVHLEMALGLADGCGAMHEHYGFEPSHTTPLFKRAGFALERERSFQLRLNHLFVFRRGIEATNRKVTTEGRADPGVLVGREANT